MYIRDIVLMSPNIKTMLKPTPQVDTVDYSIIYRGIGILGISRYRFSSIKPMLKPTKIIEQFCEPANKNTCN